MSHWLGCEARVTQGIPSSVDHLPVLCQVNLHRSEHSQWRSAFRLLLVRGLKLVKAPLGTPETFIKGPKTNLGVLMVGKLLENGLV